MRTATEKNQDEVDEEDGELDGEIKRINHEAIIA